MPSTPQTIISSALSVLGVIFPGQTPSASMSNDGLIRLNELLASWTVDRLIVYGIARNVYPLSGGVNSYTLGVGGTLGTTRPNSIDHANVITAALGLRSMLKLVTTEEWGMITDQSTTSTLPEVLYADYEYPASNILLWPTPNSSASALELFTWQALEQFVTLADVLDMPPGYELALIYNLATVLSMVYGRPMSQEAMQTATESLNRLKGINAPPTHISGAGEEAIAQAQVSQQTGMKPR